MTTFNYLKPGLGNTASYQASAIPWVSSSVALSSGEIQKFSFPQVTKFVTVKNNSSIATTLRVGFDEKHLQYSTGEYIFLSSQESISLDVKVVNMYFMTDDATNISFSVVAGLTTIQRTEYPLSLQENPLSLLSEQNFLLITENEDYIVLE
jgi:hypothetical protein